MGLVRHMAEVERSWFRRGIAGRKRAPIYYSDDDPDGDLHVGPDDTLAEALATWQGEVELAVSILAGGRGSTISIGSARSTACVGSWCT